MFDKLFGWRKASKCKKLIGRVQCRLKLLKNKRSCIARQLREDLCELLRDGHHQVVFDRVEQLFMDENLLAVYELLDNYCEFIIINLPYIRKNKDCPNDINEAVSTLIYSSARLGDLPELLLIRKLFAERYGQKFAAVALDLLPGNLVNRQIKENLAIRSVSDDVKYKLVDEITRSCFQQGPLLLGYTSEWQKQENDVQNSDSKDEQKGSEAAAETERKVVSIDGSSESKKWLKPAGEFPGLGEKKWGRAATSSPESFGKLQEEMVYLDDIAEFESSVSKDAYLQDQRLFMFNPSPDSKTETLNAETKSRVVKGEPRKLRNGSAKKLSRRSVSREIRDIQTAIYYGKSFQNYNGKARHHMKILVKDRNRSSYSADQESIYEPCLFTFIVYKHFDRESDGGVASGEDSSDSSSAENIDSWKRKHKYQPPYVCRAVTMPPERPKESVVMDSITRSNSFPVQQPDHVHPKLPDYDEIAAKFLALKREKIQNKCHLQN
ncbi:PREDICTED: uncharacterized protein LOC109155862 [Ipomoea nil]|uniref:uncharacterized protein LOC109155862 n=1 Tax=Ipomoea nil TaxID=35883 RepID=UPI000901D08D|nr:PREDICTED: uncharacterized protein LOC109155862 [Ipomoea nil]